MKKIKLLFYTELWANAGIESVIMSLFRNFDLDRIRVDIMASQNLSDFYDDEIKKLGGNKIITLQEQFDSPAKRMIANREAFKRAILKNQYDIVHLHMCNAAAMSYGKIAKQCGVKKVVFHSHNTNLSTSHRAIKTVVHTLAKYRFEKYADILLSCSDLASKWMYTPKSVLQKKVTLVKNAIDLERFEFNETIRSEYRRKLGVEGKFVVGHIGRFALAKNHSFLIDIFSVIHKLEPESVLLLIGEGEDEKLIREKVKAFDLQDSVIFYGVTRDIPQMLWAMDAFVLPSFFEGNPVVGIEAQAASTPCFFADTITKMCQLTEIVEYISLHDFPDIWANKILSVHGKARKNTRDDMEKNGYNIKSVAEMVQKMYETSLMGA